MNRKLIGSSATRHLHVLYTKTIMPTTTTSHLNNFGLPSFGQLTRRSGITYPLSIIHLSKNSLATPREIERRNNNITKKFVFHKSKITQLKAMAAVRGVHNPTPVHVLSALIFECAKASASQDSVARSPLFHLLDKRPKMTPQYPKRCEGNLRALKDLIVKRKMDHELCKENHGRDEIAIVIATKNMLVLKDAPSGESIEVLITLEKESMATFQQDKQFLQFASL